MKSPSAQESISLRGALSNTRNKVKVSLRDGDVFWQPSTSTDAGAATFAAAAEGEDEGHPAVRLGYRAARLGYKVARRWWYDNDDDDVELWQPSTSADADNFAAAATGEDEGYPYRRARFG